MAAGDEFADGEDWLALEDCCHAQTPTPVAISAITAIAATMTVVRLVEGCAWGIHGGGGSCATGAENSGDDAMGSCVVTADGAAVNA